MMKKLFVLPTLVLTLSFANPVLASSAGGTANGLGIGEMANAGINGAIGAANAPRCFKTPPNPEACITMILSFLQLAMSLMQGGQSFDARDALSPGVDWSMDPGVINPEDNPIPGHLDPGWLDPLKDAMKTGKKSDYENAKIQMEKKAQPYLDKLAAMGYSVDANGNVKGPNGAIDPSSLLGDGAADKYLAGLSNKLGELDTSGGGGMIAGSSGSGSGSFGRGLASDDDDSSGKKGGVDDFLNKLKKGEVDGSKLSGMSKGADGDRLGVAMNNIFRMIQIKYTAIDKDKQFLEK
ncbi:MAG: hypothetical protein M9899_00560 [Bdellovibrionaceae bacterium]|nr:hypothetical protein [Pseudobdellovibrionaceae bacterium]